MDILYLNISILIKEKKKEFDYNWWLKISYEKAKINFKRMLKQLTLV
jgi:hypothetical protein